MRYRSTGLLIVACLGGCGSAPDQPGASHHGGRYLGIGVYQAGRLWSRMVTANRPVDAAAANTDDDEQVIVVVDSRTGEVRQCGNLTGYCIGMNPWTGPSGQAAPVRLRQHAADLEAADRAAYPDTADNAAAGSASNALNDAVRTDEPAGKAR